MNNPLVSIVFPVYNEKIDFLEKSINSILSQTYKNIELIIADDSTNEATIKKINDYATNPKVVVNRSNSKRNLPIALNDAINIAKGDYIARADADDIQEPTRIEEQTFFLENSPETYLIGTNVIYINEEGRLIKEKKYPETNEQITKAIHIHNPISHPTIMARKAFFQSVGVYNVNLKRAEDYDLWFRAVSKNIGLYNIQKPLVCYRLSNINKRDMLNWKTNLALKFKYFSFKKFYQSFIGVLFVIGFICTPKPLKKIIYKNFS